MASRVKRWRLSDVVHAMSVAAGDAAETVSAVRKGAARDANNYGARMTLLRWDYTLPRLLGVLPSKWLGMTDAEREALVVAEARRLKVPRRA